MKKMMIASAVAVAFASVSVFADFPAFVAKGDVQSFFGWNNHALQAHLNLIEFRGYSVTANSWSCSKPHPSQDREIVQQRNNETTITAIIDTVERVKNQITGYHLSVQSSTTEADGPATGSCPAEPSGFEYDDNLVTTGGGSGLQISKDGGSTWVDFQ
jgi:hypothetical protein